MSDISKYSNEDLVRIIKEAVKANGASNRVNVATKDAVKAFFRMIGLGFIADAIDVAQYAYERIRNILGNIFGGTNKTNKDSWW
jgi:hypothetical protein